jgi:hypothetical protein
LCAAKEQRQLKQESEEVMFRSYIKGATFVASGFLLGAVFLITQKAKAQSPQNNQCDDSQRECITTGSSFGSTTTCGDFCDGSSGVN